MNNYEELLKKLNAILNQKILERNKLEEEQKEISNKLNDKDNEIKNTNAYIKAFEHILFILENNIKFHNLGTYGVTMTIFLVLAAFNYSLFIYAIQESLPTFLQLITVLFIFSVIIGPLWFYFVCEPQEFKRIKKENNIDDVNEKLERAREKRENLNKENELILEEENKRQDKIILLDEELKKIQENIRNVEGSKEMAIKMILDDAINEGRINATFSEDLEVQKTLARLPKKSRQNKM